MTTFIIGGTILGLMLGSVALWVWLLRLGLRWAKVTDVSGRRIIVVAVPIFSWNIATRIAGFWLNSEQNRQLLFVAIEAVALILLPIVLIAIVFQTSYLRALQVWLATMLTPLLMVCVALFLVRPFIMEGFQGPTNPMAPTLLGEHVIGTCPTCGDQTFCAPDNPNYVIEPSMICEHNFHITETTADSGEVFSPDRFLVAKFITPARWDIIAFQLPSDPQTLYAMRLVGLPGEEITIKDGIAFANGNALTPPEALSGLTYHIDERSTAWGSPSRPARLRKDEFFVLGDFSKRSMDSRYWKSGAPGRPPYSVPESYVVGVVSHIYWPPKRWRILHH